MSIIIITNNVMKIVRFFTVHNMSSRSYGKLTLPISNHLFPDMIAQQECSHLPLVERECTISRPFLFISRYDSTTGVFTVPPGGDGVYYFSTYVLLQIGEYGRFDMYLNDDVICTTYPDHSDIGALDFAPGSCSAVVDVVAGNIISFILIFLGGTSYFCGQ